MAQFARPTSDVTIPTGFNGTYVSIDETTASDADFVYSNDNTNGTYETLLGGVVDPVDGVGSYTIRARVSRCDTSVPNSTTGTSASIGVALYQGATLIATARAVSSVAAWINVSYSLTTPEINSITNYSDLRLQFQYSGGGGSTTNRRGVAISFAEIEIPDFVAAAFQGILKRWNGSAWVKAKNKNWNGSAWEQKPLKRWTGTEWAEVDATGI